ncbi:type II secretion system F family protein [Paraburkholderia dinghuensis]|uniref:Type II secretion system F family protein n=1 Tax=Paraburkholderia dinghuensis TaxID=2305225 RepID=A0A3N6MB95_9BURK|nr:type II secretion system F family protein [Paraburkholderia dinghuensis]RQH01059.1 type II secretion system F family protein [Paraburkholderia dinghuensis]
MTPAAGNLNRAPAEWRFAWRGVDATGAQKRGTLIAIDAAAARHALKRERITVTMLTRQRAAPDPRASPADITRFTRQLSSLLRAGLPLAPALDLLTQSPGPQALPRIVGMLARDITAGMRFSDSLARHPERFGALYCQLVAVGEASGALAAVLARIADDRERAAAQRSKVRAALTYPVAVLLLAVAITAALLIWVVPTFKQIFDGFGAALPAPTQFVLMLSAGAARWSMPAAACCAMVVVATRSVLRRFARARIAFGRFQLKLPLAGSLLTALCAARWSRALGTLLTAGTPLADAFVSLTHASGNAFFDHASAGISARLRHGERLAAAMRAAGCFPADVIQPVAVAEESGALDAMLLDVASLADRQVDEKIGLLSSLCEPLVIVVLGALVGGLVVAMYLPIIQLGNVV